MGAQRPQGFPLLASDFPAQIFKNHYSEFKGTEFAFPWFYQVCCFRILYVFEILSGE